MKQFIQNAFPNNVLDTLEFTFEGSDMRISNGDKEIFLFIEDDEIAINEDGNEFCISEIKDLEGFKKANECEYCKGSGISSELRCSKPASICCGGCYVDVDCLCKNVRFKF